MRFAIFFLIFSLTSSCIPKPGRPAAPLCTVTSKEGRCTNAQGNFTTDHSDLLCTTIDGYSVMERYVDTLELKIREYERRCPKEKARPETAIK